MAIRLPTASLRNDPARFRRGAWLLSGDGPAGSAPVLGMRELVAEANHGYAYRVQTIASSWEHANSVQFSTASTSEQDAIGPIPIEWGLHVVAVRLVVRHRHGVIKLRVNDGTTTTTSTGATVAGTLTTSTEEIALDDETLGAAGYAVIRAAATNPNTLEIVGWCIQEIVLTSGEIP